MEHRPPSHYNKRLFLDGCRLCLGEKKKKKKKKKKDKKKERERERKKRKDDRCFTYINNSLVGEKEYKKKKLSKKNFFFFFFWKKKFDLPGKFLIW